MKSIVVAMMLAVTIQASGQMPKLIPQPVKLSTSAGFYKLSQPLTIQVPAANQELTRLGTQLAESIAAATGASFRIVGDGAGAPADIRLTLNAANNPAIGNEGYMLICNAQGIALAANQPAGIFYGMQTLLQLLPPEVESKKAIAGVAWQVPYVEITDYPRFGYRGLMLDVARHFFTKQQVKDFIDNMVKYKYNMLHLHLTDDQGWRIEIKSLPKLTEVGAWRAPRQGRWSEWSKPAADEPKTYGGYYTQDDMKEIIAYAASRFVQILPEIDVPGHSMALVAAYPELSATPGTYTVNAGDRFMIWPANGHFYGLVDNNVNPASEKTYEILDKVFAELAQIFPYPYIHMGGDECYKGFWEKSEAVKQLMKREGLKGMHEVQSYFVKRVDKIIESKGKKMIGWDEIMEGGLAPGAAVMSWQGEKGGIEAAKMKHPVVMSPNTYTYVDLYQGDPVAEPPTYSMLRLSQSYKFDPLPAGVDPQYILGGQANLWSERLSTVRHAEYMLWPRGWAVAESVWSPKERKDWNDFISRAEHHFVRSDFALTKYSRSMYDPIFKFVKQKGADSIRIELSTELEGLNVHYAFDETFPDEFYPVYTQPLTVPKDAVNLRVITSRNGKLVGKMITMPVAEMKKRAK